MGFFDKVGDVLSNTGKEIATSAKNVADASSLSSQIHAQEALIQKTYLEIGKAYCNANRGNSSCTYAAQIAAVADAENKIAIYQKEINAIRGLQTCPKCGASVDQNAVFCPSCGTNLAVLRAQQNAAAGPKLICPACGMPNEADSLFCESCGQRLTPPAAPASEIPAVPAPASEMPAAPVPAPEIQNPAPAPAPAAEEASWVCRNCNTKNDPDTSFCYKCGSKRT